MKNTKRSPFNLPSAWTPGLALPPNVVDEGLQRRAFVTQQEPDGTFDNPAVGTGGYVVPQYVVDEGYGRGTFVTAWSPRGTYFGPGLPDWLNYPVATIKAVSSPRDGAVTYTMETLHGLSGTDAAPSSGLPTGYQKYGNHVASLMLNHAKSFPPARRKTELKRVMDKVDPTLWTRAASNAKALTSRGVAPNVALHQGLSVALGHGILKEVIATGKTGRRPAARGQLGLGCYGRVATQGFLGALGDATKVLTSAASPVKIVVAPAPTVRDHSGGAGEGGVTTTGSGPQVTTVRTGARADSAQAAADAALGPMMTVGPFKIPSRQQEWTLGALVRDNRTTSNPNAPIWSGMSAADQKKFGDAIVREWQLMIANSAADANSRLVPAAELGIVVPPLFKQIDGGISADDLAAHVIANVRNATGNDAKRLAQYSQPGWVPLDLFKHGDHVPPPLFRAHHPTFDKDYGLYLLGNKAAFTDVGTKAQYAGKNLSADGDVMSDAVSPTQVVDYHVGGPLRFQWREVMVADKGLWGSIWDLITDIGAYIEDAVNTVVDAIGDAACALVGSPAGLVGAAAVGGPAGVAGVKVAQGACANPAPPPMVAPSSSLLVPLAIGAAALGVVFLATHKKKGK